jgi:hypothetical protein
MVVEDAATLLLNDPHMSNELLLEDGAVIVTPCVAALEVVWTEPF